MVKYAVLAALLGGLPAAAQAKANICIDTYRIDHTDAPDDTALLITMRDKSVYRAKVQGGCVGLSNNVDGFTWAPDPGTNDICGNLFTIRLNSTRATCLMGEIEQIKPPKR
ncbi:MAG: hypothetical protein WDN04_28085 [Rhodospirillales bacterium]